MVPVKSNSISRVGYDDEKRALFVEFRTDLAYQYFDVPKGIFTGLTVADNPDEFFGRQVRSVFKHERITFHP